MRRSRQRLSTLIPTFALLTACTSPPRMDGGVYPPFDVPSTPDVSVDAIDEEPAPDAAPSDVSITDASVADVLVADGSTGDAGPRDAAPDAASTTCMVTPPTSCPTPAPRYNDVEPIFRSRCIVCHYGAAGGPWSLDDYSHVSDWQDTIRDELIRCSMPPSDAGIAMTDGERLAILQWLRCGLPP